MGYFLLTYDQQSMRVLEFNRHGRDFVGAVLALAAQIDQYHGHPSVAVRLDEAASLEEFFKRHSDLLVTLELPDGPESARPAAPGEP